MIKPRDRQATFEEQWRANLGQKHCMLDEIDDFVDWKPIEARLNEMYKKDSGRPAIAPLGMFKLLQLEFFYDLSDVRVVEELRDRRSFERFCDIDLTAHKVDDTSLVKFRNSLREASLMEPIFELFNQQLDRRGLILRKGTLVDSTLIKGAVQPCKTGSDGKVLDPDVAHTARNGRAHDGMKVSIAVDQGTEIIRTIIITPANINDDQLLASGIPPGRQEKLYADKGYASRRNRAILELLGIQDGILHKAAPHHPLNDTQIATNKHNSRIRDAIEHKFAEAKRWHGMARLRYLGTARHNHRHQPQTSTPPPRTPTRRGITAPQRLNIGVGRRKTLRFIPKHPSFVPISQKTICTTNASCFYQSFLCLFQRSHIGVTFPRPASRAASNAYDVSIVSGKVSITIPRRLRGSASLPPSVAGDSK